MKAIKNALLKVVGFIALILGTAGIVLPLLPTTPFILLAVFCFSSANPKMAVRLRESRIFGEYLSNWYEGTGVRWRYKIKALILTWVGIGTSIYLMEPLWLSVMLGIIGLCVSTHLLMLKTKGVAE